MAPPPRKPKPPEHPPNHERWVISYADLLTLLLATFVVLYASSTQNKHKLDAISASFVKAFRGTPPAVVNKSGGSKGVMAHNPAAIRKPVEVPSASHLSHQMEQKMSANMMSLDKVKQQLTKLLSPMIVKSQVSINSQPLTLTIQLDASVLFPSGSDQLRPAAMTLLSGVGKSLVTLPPPFTVVVQGYTDDQPITTAQFSSNWALSAARAVRVVELFGSQGVAGAQLAAEGFGEFTPVAPNDSDTDRALNRRVLIVIHAPDPAPDADSPAAPAGQEPAMPAPPAAKPAAAPAPIPAGAK